MKSIRIFPLALLFVTSAFAESWPIVFHAPPELQPMVRELQRVPDEKIASLQRVTGLRSADQPVDITLAPESSTLAKQSPSWMTGFTFTGTTQVVLFPARNPRYPNDSLESTYLHELTHVFIARAAGGRYVPRWFHEGVAVVAERTWSFEDEARFSWALFRMSKVTPQQLDAMFQGDEKEVTSAYAISEAIVRDLATSDPKAIAAILHDVAEGKPFDLAYFDATAYVPENAFRHFWERQSWRANLIPILSSGTLGWFIVAMVAIAAIRRRRKRDELITEAWSLEDQRDDLREEARQREPDDELVN